MTALTRNKNINSHGSRTWHLQETSHTEGIPSLGMSAANTINPQDPLVSPLPTMDSAGKEASYSRRVERGYGGSSSGVGVSVGVGSGGDSSVPDVKSLEDLVELLHTSDNPLWDLIRFEVRYSY